MQDNTQKDAKGPLLMLKKRLKKRVLLERQVEGPQVQKGLGINWGYNTDAEEKKKKKVKRTTKKQGGDTINSHVYFSFILQTFQIHKLVNFFLFA